MKITSHFVWIKLKSELLVDLYVALQKELGAYQTALEFQNILSVHITLYYLSDKIWDMRIKETRWVLNNFEFPIIEAKNFAYFWDQSSSYLCYISLAEFSKLKDMNKTLKTRFPEYALIQDNTHPFTPHITLFKVRDMDAFLEKRERLEEILRDYLAWMKDSNLFSSFEIFKVNSEFKPEIQIKI